MKQFAGVLTTSVGAVSRALDTRVKGTPVVIYNPAGFPVSDVVEVTLPAAGAKFAVYDDKGARVPSQVLDSRDGKTRLLVRLPYRRRGMWSTTSARAVAARLPRR